MATLLAAAYPDDLFFSELRSTSKPWHVEKRKEINATKSQTIKNTVYIRSLRVKYISRLIHFSENIDIKIYPEPDERRIE